MPTQNPEDAAPDDEHVLDPEDTAAPTPRADDEVVPPKQIHRWKGEGGALHPDD